MPQYICKLSDGERPLYFLWSTIVDAPITRGYLREDFKNYYIRLYGEESAAELDRRMARVEETGTSCLDQTLEEIIGWNRAGPKETSLSREELIVELKTGVSQ